MRFWPPYFSFLLIFSCCLAGESTAQSAFVNEETSLQNNILYTPASMPETENQTLIIRPGIQESNNLTTITAYKYWFDNDAANAVTVTGTYNNTDLIQATISTSTVSPGVHTVTVGFSDGTYWSSFTTTLFYKPVEQTISGSLQYEYWTNNPQNRTLVNAGNSGTFILNSNLLLQDLHPGLNNFNIRFKPDGKLWSSISGSLIYVAAGLSSGTPVAEYWIDSAYQQKTSTTVVSSNNLVFVNIVPLAGISSGVHTFNIRFRPDGTSWSSTLSSLFYKPELSGASITTYEYWFDKNYAGHVTTTVTPATNLLLPAALPAGSLVDGPHQLHMRFKTSAGKWSSTQSSFFFKDHKYLIPVSDLVKQIYWIDNDWTHPQTIQIIGGTDINWTLNTDLSSISEGRHLLSQMFKDNRGDWSSIVSDSFTRAPLTSPVCQGNTRTLVSGIIGGSGVTFQWQMNSGSGFVNISDNAVYSGTQTDSLQIINAPGSLYGNLYRCLVTYNSNTLTGTVYTLKYQLTWTGAVDQAWENPANWNCYQIPDANTDVFINSGLPRYPQVNSTGFCRSLNMQPGSAIEIMPGKNLQVTK